jgi:hypothetical protein
MILAIFTNAIRRQWGATKLTEWRGKRLNLIDAGQAKHIAGSLATSAT